MEPIAWLDVPLVLLGVFTLTLSAARWFRRRPRRAFGTMTAFFLGLGSLVAAAVDVGLSQWDKARRLTGDVGELRMVMRVDLPEGSLAPDVALPCLDDGRTVRLSDFRGRKPVVLIFGSFT